MGFAKFVRACKKYNFTFVLSSFGKLRLTLHPKNTFEKIELDGSYFKYRNLFSRAIKEMKQYRTKGVKR